MLIDGGRIKCEERCPLSLAIEDSGNFVCQNTLASKIPRLACITAQYH